jgi:chromosome segregation ATPase
MTSFRLSVRFLLLFACFCLPATSAEAQSSKTTDDKTLQALLNEVRLLRETLQRINLNAYRSQMIVERIREQNERVTRLDRMLEGIRDEMANLPTQISQISERAKTVESQIQQESDLKQRAQLEDMQKELKSLRDQQREKLERLRERESRLTTELQAEQAKLSDLEGRLDALEREIENAMEKPRSKNP